MVTRGRAAVVPFSSEYEAGRLFDVGSDLDRDGSLKTWRQVRKCAAEHGWSVDTADRMGADRPDVWIHLDAFGPLLAEEHPARTILMMFEPEVVAPFWYRQLRHNAPGIVFTHRMDLVRAGGPFRYLFWPQTFDLDDSSTSERSEFLVMINARKYPARHRGELYSARERVAVWFARHSDISVYGRGWSHSSRRHPLSALRTPSLRTADRGLIRSKAEVLARARFVLCFENMRSPGFRSEKLFDVLASGAIPVYLGDPEITSVVPQEAFIDYAATGGPRALDHLLRSMTPAEEDAMRRAGREYLASPMFEPYTVDAFARRLTAAILELAQR